MKEWRNRIIATGDEAPDQLLANPKNFRRHPKHQQEALRGVLNEVGWVQDVIVNRTTGRLVDGHLRVELALRDGATTVPVKYVELSDAEESLILATFDPISALATADKEQLDALLREVSTGEAGVQQMLADLAEREGIVGLGGATEGLTDADEVPEPPVEPTSRLGDLWVLGEHRVLCGDSTIDSDVASLMNKEQAAMMFTDPPYAIFGSSTGVGGDVADDKMIRPFFRDVLTASRKHTKKNAHLYICCDWRSWYAWWEVAKPAKLQIKNCIVWDKGSPGMGSMFMSQHELILFATNSWQDHMEREGTKHRLVRDSNVWQEGRPSIIDKTHNAQKPVALIKRALEASSDAGDLVLDLFGGSGSTLIACEELNRRASLMEIDPKYVDVIVQRWETFTGRTAELHRSAEAAD